MKIYALTGKSGTGKSYHALELCSKLGIDAIIDDGLFIVSGIIIAGVSAKKQKTVIKSIKTAVFANPTQRDMVASAIKTTDPKSILVLGTSDEMVDVIAERLGLPKVSEYIHIEDITTQSDREKAREYRDSKGMHSIPAPSIQVRRQFSGYFIDPRRSFRHSKGAGEQTIVRPKYSYFGKFEISEKVIRDIIGHIVEVTPGVSQLLLSSSSADDDNNMYIRAAVSMEWGAAVQKVAEIMQAEVIKQVSLMTSFNILGVEIEIRGFRAKNM